MEEQLNKEKSPKQKKNKKFSDSAKVGIAIAASSILFFGSILAIEAGIRDHNSTSDVIGHISPSTPINPSTSTSDDPVIEVPDVMKELVNKPVTSDIEIVRPFYDNKDSEQTRENAIIEIDGMYRKNDGVDYKNTDKFDVYSSFSGKVIKIANDSTYGNVIFIEHESGIVASYSSLGTTTVVQNQEIKQGDIIGTSGQSLYTNGLGESLHFTLLKDDKSINPSKSFGQLVKDL